MSQPQQSGPTVGFITVEHSETLGWTGGYLVLNSGGRPLEFHCTLPVRPSRAHEILYGRTLRSYLISEVIMPALLKQSKSRPQLLCTDLPELMAVAENHLKAPFGFISEGQEFSTASDLSATGDRVTVRLPRRDRLQVSAADAPVVENVVEQLRDLVDWMEPLSRIREAIREAQSGAAARAA